MESASLRAVTSNSNYMRMERIDREQPAKKTSGGVQPDTLNGSLRIWKGLSDGMARYDGRKTGG